MEIILSKQCESITGSLGEGFGYAVQRRTDLKGRTRFWGVRKSTGAVPSDGHLRFIFACAELAQAKLHITDIRIAAKELRGAIREARRLFGVDLIKAPARKIYNAADVLTLKENYGL